MPRIRRLERLVERAIEDHERPQVATPPGRTDTTSTSTTEGPNQNRELAAELRQLAAKLEALPGQVQPPAEERIAQASKDALMARNMATVALTIVLLELLFVFVAVIL